MQRRKLLTGGLSTAALVPLALPLPARAEDRWLPLRDAQFLGGQGGNALDFSGWAGSAPAGQFGWARAVDGAIGFERRPQTERFLCASLVPTAPNGGIPSREEAGRWASELRRTGYNAVRLHFVDAALMEGRTRDFDFDLARLDNLHYLMAQLKAQGLYWIVDGLTSDNGAYGDVGPNRFVNKHTAKLDVLLSDAGFDHWAGVVDRLWGVKNPHTGATTLEDPALLGIILVNEGGLAFNATIRGGRYPEAVAAPFRRWLQRRYGSQGELRRAWGAELRTDEALDGQVAAPGAVRGQARRDKDFARFVAETEAAAFERMDTYVRKRGFGGLASAYDSWGFLAADVARARAPWIDMHAYHTEPTRHGEPGSTIGQTSLLQNMARAPRELANSRQWGKPFTVSEYGQPFWNAYRYEMPAWVSAMAAHQGWSLICQFAELPLPPDGAPTTVARKKAIYPYGVGTDPIGRAGERLAALLFRRGDVTASPHRIRLHVDPDAMFERSAGWEQVPEAVSRLAFVAPIGLDLGPVPSKAAKGEVSIDLGSTSPWVSRLQNLLTRAGVEAGDVLEPLRSAGILDASNATRPGAQRYESDTHELLLDGAARQLAIKTPRMVVATVADGGGAAHVGPLAVEQASGPVLVAVASLDGKALGDSRRLLWWVLTDAQNTGMTFSDPQRTTLQRLGTLPAVVRAIAVQLRLTSAAALGLRAWSLGLNGDRRDPVALQGSGGTVTMNLDTSALPGGPALYFEWAAA